MMSDLVMIGYIKKNVQGNRVYDPKGVAATLASDTGGLGGKGVSLIYENKGDDVMTEQSTIFDYINEEETKDVSKKYEPKPFKYISLFAGVGGFDFGLNAVGGECVFASEIDKFASQAYGVLHGSEHLHGDITEINAEDIPDHDVIAAGFPCFVAGTLINTSEGLKPIEDVKAGDLVLTHNNRLKEVVVPMVKEADSILTVKINGSVPTKVTTEHPYYIVEREDVWDNEERRYVRTFGDPKWVNAQDLIPGKHYVGFAEDHVSENSLDITEDEAYIIGRYIADGYLNTSPRSGRKNSHNRKVILCVGKDKLEDFVESVGDSYHFGNYEDQTVYKCTATSQRLVDLCELVGRGAENKEFPPEIINLPTELLSIVLDGYISGDGSYKDGVTSATTVSKKLAISLARVIRKVYGVQASIHYTNRPPKSVIEGRVINQRDTYRVQFRKNPQKTVSTKIDGILFSPVRSVEHSDENNLVYNFEVEGDNSYTANGCTVHNCQAFSVAGKRGGFNDARGTLFFEVARIASEKQPKALLLENVKGLIGHDSGKTLDTIVKTLNQIGYRVDFDVLNSKYFGVPQNRERIFIVAVREDLVENEEWTNVKGNTIVPKGKRRISGYDDVKTFNFDFPTNDTVDKRLVDVLEESVDERYYLSEEKTSQLILNADLSGKLNYFAHRSVDEVHSTNGVSPTIDTMQGGSRQPKIVQAVGEGLPIKEATKQGYAVACEGDAVNIQYPSSKTRRGRVGKDGQAQTLEASGINQGVVEPTLRIRKLTPLECWRLQGFTDEQHDAVESAGISNSQRYKQAGNAVTVNVIEALGNRLLPYL